MAEGYTNEELLNVGKFVASLVGLKAFKTGMETGNLPKLADKYIRLFVREFAKNPEAPIMLGLGALGLWEGKDEDDLKVKLVRAIAPMAAYKMVVSGSNLAFGVGAAYLSLFGMGFLMSGFPTPEEAVGSAQDYVKDVFGDPDIPDPIVVGEVKWLGMVHLKCPVGDWETREPTLVGAYKSYYAHYRSTHMEVEG